MPSPKTPQVEVETNPLGYVIFVTGEINQELADLVGQRLLECDINNMAKGEDTPITLIINSGGGSLHAGWMICDIMDFIKTPVYTTGMGLIASAALIIFMNGHPGHRVLSDRAAIMSHRYSWGVEGSHTDLLAVQPEISQIHNRITQHYQECTHLSMAVIEKKLLTTSDVWLTPDAAKKFNIADTVIKSKKTKELKNVNRRTKRS